MDRYTSQQAVEFLEGQADYFINENYHSEASACHKAIDRISKIEGPTTFVLECSDFSCEFIVEP